ncbi:MAG TPA: class I SAM-dependent methyltransferase [Nitriliruptorales bacterium]|nr:class I SAM-dependent methyltransferase [Nitriliruptorales bacterium]
MSLGSAVERWAEALACLTVPKEILAAAPEVPWGFPTELFRRRAEAALREAPTPSHRRSLEALPEGGVVIDVGVGAGAGSLPLAARASLIVGVDSSPAMLEQFAEAAQAAGARVEGVVGEWPAVAAQVAEGDVVVCHNVLYNVPDLSPFVEALSSHARRRVVVEISEHHPLAWMGDLWERFHGWRRPPGPTAAEAEAALRELVEVHSERFTRPVGGGFASRLEAIAMIRRRLCLPAERDDEIVEALEDRLGLQDGLWFAGTGTWRAVTFWWDR